MIFKGYTILHDMALSLLTQVALDVGHCVVSLLIKCFLYLLNCPSAGVGVGDLCG